MKVRKSLFSAAAVGLLFGGSSITERATPKAVPAPHLAADGGDPMPLPKPTQGTAIIAGQVAPISLVADGGDPMPRPPRQLA